MGGHNGIWQQLEDKMCLSSICVTLSTNTERLCTTHTGNPECLLVPAEAFMPQTVRGARGFSTQPGCFTQWEAQGFVHTFRFYDCQIMTSIRCDYGFHMRCDSIETTDSFVSRIGDFIFLPGNTVTAGASKTNVFRRVGNARAYRLACQPP